MTGTFIRVKCKDCGNEQILFSRAAIEVKCLVCDSTIARPAGGKAIVQGEIVGPVN